jgi:hypothetical protein
MSQVSSTARKQHVSKANPPYQPTPKPSARKIRLKMEETDAKPFLFAAAVSLRSRDGGPRPSLTVSLLPFLAQSPSEPPESVYLTFYEIVQFNF